MTGGPLLALDAAPGVGSVAVVRGGAILATRAVLMRPARGPAPADDDPLMRAVDEALRTAGVAPQVLAAVACGAGPGGFTGLRIAASIAKGLAHALGRPLLAAPSLAWGAAVRAPSAGAWLATLDALRGERYAARVRVGERAAVGRRVDAYEYLGPLPADALGAAACGTDGALDLDATDLSLAPLAAGVVALPPEPVDLAAWEPAYGRLAEAQARWEAVHGPLDPLRPAPAGGSA